MSEIQHMKVKRIYKDQKVLGIFFQVQAHTVCIMSFQFNYYISCAFLDLVAQVASDFSLEHLLSIQILAFLRLFAISRVTAFCQQSEDTKKALQEILTIYQHSQ